MTLKKSFADAEITINEFKNRKNMWACVVYFFFINRFLETKYTLKELRDVINLGIKLGIK